MIAESFRCLRDPNCERHPWHAGHLTKLCPVDPQTSYEVRQRHKSAGKQAWREIQLWQKYWGKNVHMTRLERFMLFVFVRDAIFSALSH